MKTIIAALLRDAIQATAGWKNPHKLTHNDKHAMKNKVEFHRKRDRRK